MDKVLTITMKVSVIAAAISVIYTVLIKSERKANEENEKEQRKPIPICRVRPVQYPNEEDEPAYNTPYDPTPESSDNEDVSVPYITHQAIHQHLMRLSAERREETRRRQQ